MQYEQYFNERRDDKISELACFLGSNLSEEILGEIKQFIDPALRESNVGDKIWKQNLSQKVKKLYLNLINRNTHNVFLNS